MKFIRLIDSSGKVLIVNKNFITCIYYDTNEGCYCLCVNTGVIHLLSADFIPEDFYSQI